MCCRPTLSSRRLRAARRFASKTCWLFEKSSIVICPRLRAPIMCKAHFASAVTLKTPQMRSMGCRIEVLALTQSGDCLPQSGFGSAVDLINYYVRRIYNYILLSGARDGEAPKGRLQ